MGGGLRERCAERILAAAADDPGRYAGHKRAPDPRCHPCHNGGGGHTGGRGLCAGGDRQTDAKRGVAAPYPRAGWTVIRAPIHKATRGGIHSNSQQRRPTTGPGTVPLRSIGAVAAPASEPLRPSPLPTDRVPGPHGESPAKRCDVSWRLGVSVRWTPRVAQASPAPLTGCPDMARHAQTLRPSLDDASPDD